MSHSPPFLLELSPGAAALYLRGALTPQVVRSLRRVCAALPRSIRVLRLDARALTPADDASLDLVATLAREWRIDRDACLIALPDGPPAPAIGDARVA